MAISAARIEGHLSTERLAPYRHGGLALDQAIQLYEWNSKISAALWLDVGHLEVLVRNAVHNELSTWCSRRYRHPHWYDDPGCQLGKPILTNVREARDRLTRAGKPHDAGRLVAELNFGIWRYLLASRYDRSLWKPALIHGFPGQPRRGEIHRRLAALHQLRNRLAHHEPVHNQPLAALHRDLSQIVSWISTDLAEWVQRQSRVRVVLAGRPT